MRPCVGTRAGSPLPGTGQAEARGMPGMRGPVGDPRAAVPRLAPPDGAALYGQDALAGARSYAESEAASAEILRGGGQGRKPVGTILLETQIALGKINGASSTFFTTLDWAAWLAVELDAVMFSDDPIGEISLRGSAILKRLWYIARLVLPKALVYVFERLFPGLASGGGAESAVERAVARLAGSPIAQKVLFLAPGFFTRATSLGSEPAHELASPTADSEAALGFMSLQEMGIGVAEDAGTRRVNSAYVVKVALDEPKEACGGPSQSTPAGRREHASLGPCGGPSPTRVSPALTAINVFLIVRWILSLWRIADAVMSQELAAYAPQVVQILLKLFAG